MMPSTQKQAEVESSIMSQMGNSEHLSLSDAVRALPASPLCSVCHDSVACPHGLGSYCGYDAVRSANLDPCAVRAKVGRLHSVHVCHCFES